MSILPDLIFFFFFFTYEVESAWFALSPGMFNILALAQGHYRHVLRKKNFFLRIKDEYYSLIRYNCLFWRFSVESRDLTLSHSYP